ncbi:hypothetical protein FSP39_007824 [Pinctada imbricata]|uniref:Protein sleepless n=1 Tax=Pinctada imbricata TaxID=66713 RepID=A0AA88YC74_PINIB|nr:hypothetical protein FSP39_007824 [Pinctada imbricata]
MKYKCFGLECYDCASRDDQRCLDPFDDVRKEAMGTSECSEKNTHCVKYKTVVFLQDSGFILGKERELNVITRTCITMKGYKDGCTIIEGDGGFYFRCLCSTDNCNSGRNLLPSIITLLIASVLALVLNSR